MRLLMLAIGASILVGFGTYNVLTNAPALVVAFDFASATLVGFGWIILITMKLEETLEDKKITEEEKE